MDSGSSPDTAPQARFTAAAVRDLIADYPLAWVRADGAPAALLPLLAVCDDGGAAIALVGHLARRNPLAAALAGDDRATILFTGPQAYVSPAMVSDPDWAPTWNYAAIEFQVRVRLEEARGAEAIDDLLAAMDARAPTGWTPAALGARRDGMLAQIIAFRAEIVGQIGRFKLGQDEKIERLREIVARHPDTALVRWMRRFNAERLEDRS